MFALLGGLRARTAWPWRWSCSRARRAPPPRRRPSGRRRLGRYRFTARAVRHASSHQVLPSTLHRSGGCTVASPGPPWPSRRLLAMLFLADPVRAATDHVLSRYGPRRADARSRACAGEKLLPAITSTGERFVESGNDHASDTEVLVIALLVILFEPSPNETQERAALARARARDVQSGPAGRRRRRPPAPAAPGLLAVFSQRLRTRPNIPPDSSASRRGLRGHSG